jgi:hypothetical protein
MASNPPPPPPPPPTSPVNPLEDALKFAEALADREIAAIDRLHQRAVKYIGYVAGAFGLLLSFFAWLGYKNLQETAIVVATKEVQDEVVRQVRTQLTTKGLTDVVHGETDAFVKGELRNQLHAEITTGPLHQEILSTASTQSRQLINSELAPRHFTDAQAVKLEAAIARSPDLIDYPVTARPQGFDLEAERYCGEIGRALLVSKVKRGDAMIEPQGEPTEGVVIYFDDRFDRKYADSLAQAFKSAGVNTTTQGTSFTALNPPGGKPTLLVFVGPKGLSTNQSK